jgi:hypothetical protein
MEKAVKCVRADRNGRRGGQATVGPAAHPTVGRSLTSEEELRLSYNEALG